MELSEPIKIGGDRRNIDPFVYVGVICITGTLLLICPVGAGDRKELCFIDGGFGTIALEMIGWLIESQKICSQ